MAKQRTEYSQADAGHDLEKQLIVIARRHRLTSDEMSGALLLQTALDVGRHMSEMANDPSREDEFQQRAWARLFETVKELWDEASLARH